VSAVGPARIVGDFGSGKTTLLRDEAARCDAPLVLCATAASAAAFGFDAMTFWGLAVDIISRHQEPVRLLTTAEQHAVVAELLGRPAPEMADAVAHYQASFLGLEELRTHADAAGVAEPWEGLARLADRYLDQLREQGLVDWGGALVQASLLLRDEDVAAAERGRFDRVMVDDYEAASFAAQRLLAQLTGPGGHVTVAGNPDAGVWAPWGGSVRYLARFDRRFGAERDVRLDDCHRSAVDGDGAEASAVLVMGMEPADVADGLRAQGVDAHPWPPDPWVPPPDAEPGRVPVLPVVQAVGLAWDTVALITGAPMPAVEPTLDLELLGGPDLPDAATRAARAAARHDALLRLARSRATQKFFKRSRP
jgi:hypothetical protein